MWSSLAERARMVPAVKQQLRKATVSGPWEIRERDEHALLEERRRKAKAVALAL
jgi:hypothetical protein